MVGIFVGGGGGIFTVFAVDQKINTRKNVIQDHVRLSPMGTGPSSVKFGLRKNFYSTTVVAYAKLIQYIILYGMWF